jgi:magnesium transporter
MNKRSQKTGLPPGTLMYVGDKSAQTTHLSIIDYNETTLREVQITDLKDLDSFLAAETITWLNVDGLKDILLLETIGKKFNLHTLTLEDVLHTEQRPKFEEFDDYLYIVLKMLTYDTTKGDIHNEQVSFIVTTNCVITFQEDHEGDVLETIRERIRTAKGRVRKRGSDYLAYALLDAIVDHYFVILENLSEKIDKLEDKILHQPNVNVLNQLNKLKRQMIWLRKSIWPVREILASLDRNTSPLIQDSTKIYLRDLYDHTVQVMDTIETFRDILSGLLDVYLSSSSNRMNSVMKVLTIITTIFMPLTFIAGIYGMNFDYMPELHWELGYPFSLAIMVGITLIMMWYFKKKEWL